MRTKDFNNYLKIKEINSEIKKLINEIEKISVNLLFFNENNKFNKIKISRKIKHLENILNNSASNLSSSTIDNDNTEVIREKLNKEKYYYELYNKNINLQLQTLKDLKFELNIKYNKLIDKINNLTYYLNNNKNNNLNNLSENEKSENN